MKKIITLILAVLTLALCFASCNTANDNGESEKKPSTTDSSLSTSSSSNSNATQAPSTNNSGADASEPHVAPKLEEIDFTRLDSIDGISESATETDYVMIKIRDFGDIVIRLYPDVAPKTVANFKKLVSEKFYDGLTFHRVIKNFMIQGGDPLGNGTGGSNTTIDGEFSSNGFENNLIHKKGVISMARSNNPNSASSQFFICHKTKSSLDGSYAAFGYVVYGIEVVDAVASVQTNSNDKPLEDVVIESIRFVNLPA